MHQQTMELQIAPQGQYSAPLTGYHVPAGFALVQANKMWWDHCIAVLTDGYEMLLLIMYHNVICVQFAKKNCILVQAKCICWTWALHAGRSALWTVVCCFLWYHPWIIDTIKGHASTLAWCISWWYLNRGGQDTVEIMFLYLETKDLLLEADFVHFI